VSAASRWAFLDRFGWRPEGCTEVGWSSGQWGVDSVEHRSMRRVLDPFNAQLRANLLKTGLLEKLRQRAQARAVQLCAGEPIASPAVAAGIPGGAAVEDAMVDNGWHPTLLECARGHAGHEVESPSSMLACCHDVPDNCRGTNELHCMLLHCMSANAASCSWILLQSLY
jgi:hypothetical protein